MTWLPGLLINLFLPDGKKNPSIRPKGEKAFAAITTLSIVPLAQNKTFNVRAMPDLKTPVIQTVTKAVPATGWIWHDPNDSFKRFWVEVYTPKGKGWVRADVSSWQGKTSNSVPAAQGKERPKQTDGFEAKLKGKTVGFLATSPKVNVRSSPEIKPDNILHVANYSTGSKWIGTGTGTIKKEGKVFWIELLSNGKKAWVRSDAVYWKGPVSVKEQVEKKAVDVKEGFGKVWDQIKTPVFLGLGLWGANQLGLFKKKG